MLLEIDNISAGYGFLQVLWDVSLKVDKGEYVCILGTNGAGKSTLLKTIAGIIKPNKGKIVFNGEEITSLDPEALCRKKISYISEELNLFLNMSVRENLILGGYTIDDRKAKDRVEYVFHLFPRLKERADQFAGTLSGGERKMLAIARGLMIEPALILIDEPSLGLAPQVTNSVFDALDASQKEGTTILLVEQNVKKTLKKTDRGYIVEKGKIILEGNSKDLAENEQVRRSYLGI